MGGYCGYLALLGGLSGGAVRVYLHEEGITLKDLAHDIERMVDSFRVGQRLFLTVMNEKASPMYTSDFLCRLFEQESAGAVRRPRAWCSARPSRAAAPARSTGSWAPGWPRTPSTGCRNQIDTGKSGGAVIGLVEGKVRILSLRRAEELADWDHRGRSNSGGCNCVRSSTSSPGGSR